MLGLESLPDLPVSGEALDDPGLLWYPQNSNMERILGNGTKFISSFLLNATRKDEYHVNSQSKGDTIYGLSLALVCSLAAISVVINASCVVRILHVPGFCSKICHVLRFQLYIACIGSSVYSVLFFSSFNYIIENTDIKTFLIVFMNVFSDICVTTTTFMTVSRYRAIKSPFSARLNRRHIVLYLNMSLVIPVIGNLGLSSCELLSQRWFWSNSSALRTYFLFISIYTVFFILFDLLNIVFFCLSIFIYRKYAGSTAARVDLLSRAKRDRKAMRTMLIGGLVNSVFLLPRCVDLISIHAKIGSSNLRALLYYRPHIYSLSFLVVTLTNPFIYTGYAELLNILGACRRYQLRQQRSSKVQTQI